MGDTALRLFKTGSVLRYGFEIYNSKLNAKTASLQTKIRVFRDGKLLLDGRQIPVNTSNQSDLARIKVTGAISIGKAMPPGDYILQIVVTDDLAKQKSRIATQFVQFEVVE